MVTANRDWSGPTVRQNDKKERDIIAESKRKLLSIHLTGLLEVPSPGNVDGGVAV